MRTWALVLFCASVGCDSTPRVGGHKQPPPALAAAPEAWQGVSTLAVMPPDNWTTDIDLQYTNWFRAVIMACLHPRGWNLVSLPVVHRAMTGWKFTMVGELGMFKPSELCQKFGCDALVYWDILETGSSSAKLCFSCVKADGTVLWATGPRLLSPEYNIVEGREKLTDVYTTFSVAIGECLRDFPTRTP